MASWAALVRWSKSPNTSTAPISSETAFRSRNRLHILTPSICLLHAGIKITIAADTQAPFINPAIGSRKQIRRMKREIHALASRFDVLIGSMLRAMVMIIAGMAACWQFPASAQTPTATAPDARSPAVQSSVKTHKLTPTDFSKIRGANYRGANAADTTDYWRHYDPQETERDLGYADKLKLNQLRVFVNQVGWSDNQSKFRKNLIDLAQACERHHIGLMVVIGNSESMIVDDAAHPINFDAAREFVADLVKDHRQ